MAKRKLLTAKLSKAKPVSWDKIVPKSVLSLEKDSKAAIVQDRKGRPYLFVFDTFAFLDILSAIDEKLVDRLSSDEYHSKEVNPTGWLIDEIETRLPLDSTYIKSLKDAINEAKEKGWIPIEKIEQELNFRHA